MRSLPNASSSTLKKSISNLKSTYYIPRAKTPTLVMHLLLARVMVIFCTLWLYLLATNAKQRSARRDTQQQGYTVVADLTVNMRRLYHVFLRSSSSTFVVWQGFPLFESLAISHPIWQQQEQQEEPNDLLFCSHFFCCYKWYFS